MKPRILSLLAVLALLVAPFGMVGGGGAAAMTHGGPETAMAHCDDMAPAGTHHGGDRDGSIDCAIACAALPAFAPASPGEILRAAAAPAPLPAASLVGTMPEADPPPPRNA